MKAVILCTIAILSSTLCGAYESDFLENSLLIQLHSERDTSIRSVSQEKYYLNPERVSLEQEGLFLYSDLMGRVPLSQLCQDQGGLYIMREIVRWACDDCKRIYNDKPSECSCGGTSFSRC